jgi:hypothetical protein
LKNKKTDVLNPKRVGGERIFNVTGTIPGMNEPIFRNTDVVRESREKTSFARSGALLEAQIAVAEDRT